MRTPISKVIDDPAFFLSPDCWALAFFKAQVKAVTSGCSRLFALNLLSNPVHCSVQMSSSLPLASASTETALFTGETMGFPMPRTRGTEEATLAVPSSSLSPPPKMLSFFFGVVGPNPDDEAL